MTESPQQPSAGSPGGESPTEEFGGGTTTLMPETAAALVELEQLRSELAAAEERARHHWDQYLRAVAELENVRKRAQRDVEAAHRFGVEKLVQELIPVKDSLDLAIESAAKADAAALAEGQAATQRLLARVLEKSGVTEIDPLGAPFDANLHEAMATQPSATAEPNSVIAVVQRGYSLHGRLLRPARVIVAQSPA